MESVSSPSFSSSNILSFASNSKSNLSDSIPSSTSISSSSFGANHTSKELQQRYQRTGHRLGEGTFGEVLEAIDTETGEIVALKRIYLKDTEKNCK